MRRVLLGVFDEVLDLGVRDILSQGGVEVLDGGCSGVRDALLNARPDVVVLDDDKEDTRALVEHIVHRYPAITVITCSSVQPTMRIFPAFHHGESYIRPLDASQLAREVLGS